MRKLNTEYLSFLTDGKPTIPDLQHITQRLVYLYIIQRKLYVKSIHTFNCNIIFHSGYIRKCFKEAIKNKTYGIQFLC